LILASISTSGQLTLSSIINIYFDTHFIQKIDKLPPFLNTLNLVRKINPNPNWVYSTKGLIIFHNLLSNYLLILLYFLSWTCSEKNIPILLPVNSIINI
jgi:hypothetical protein